MIIFTLTFVAMLMAAIFCMYSNFHIYVKTFSIFYLIIATLLVIMLTTGYRGTAIYYKQLPSELIVYGQRVNAEEGWIEIHCSTKPDSQSMLIQTDYDNELHKAMDSGRKKSNGQPYVLKSKEGNGKGKEGEGKGKGEGKEGKDKGKGGSLSHESKRYWSEPMPKPLMPNKG